MTDRKSVDVNPSWLALYRDLGIEPGNVLRRAQLPEDLFVQDGAKLTVAEYFRLWTASEAELGEPELPIRLAEAITSEAFNPMVFAALCSANLTIAMRRIAEYKQLIAPVTMTVEMRDDGLFVTRRWEDNGERNVPASLAALDLVLLVQIARMGLRERVVPVCVASHIPMEPVEAYTEYLGIAPTEGSERSVTFRPEDAQRPFLTANDAIWQTFEPQLQRRLNKLDNAAPTHERTRSVLLESLPSGEVSIEETARRLGLSPRTLQRRLKHENTSFKEIVRMTRKDLAHHYLTNTQISYPEIAYLIGFEETSSFFRAFRKWTGQTPESVRLSTRTEHPATLTAHLEKMK